MDQDERHTGGDRSPRDRAGTAGETAGSSASLASSGSRAPGVGRQRDLEEEIHLWLPALADRWASASSDGLSAAPSSSWGTGHLERGRSRGRGPVLAPRLFSQPDLLAAVRRLPPGEYEVVLGWRIAGRRQREVAQDLRISERTLQVWYRRALRRLARFLGGPPPSSRPSDEA